MSRIALRTDALRFAPSRRRRAGRARARRPRRRSTSGRGRGARPAAAACCASAYSISTNSRSSPSTGTRFSPDEAADAVVGVHDEVAELQVAQVREERLAPACGARRTTGAPRRRSPPPSRAPGAARAAGIRPRARRRRRRRRPRGARGDVESVLERQPLQLLDAAGRTRGDEDLFAGRERLRQVRGRLGRPARVAGDRLGGQADSAVRRRPRGRAGRTAGATAESRSRIRPGRMHELLGGERVPVRIPIGREALVEAATSSSTEAGSKMTVSAPSA